ncbi:Arc family DNA-binding protein [Agrobacterium rubi]|nr:Arc family DNA-binding protein [Agrobacterium rubi]NTF24137.1 Arc family DNA-binding protein [Agrobacterium rubi]
MDEKRTSRERVALRVPDELKRRLNASASRSGRTLNAEIISRLLQSYGDELDTPVPENVGRPRSLEMRVADLEEIVARLSSAIEGDH